MEQSGTGLIELKIVALSHSKDHQSYAVVLESTATAAERMAIVIGAMEARQLSMAVEIAGGNLTASVKFMEDLLIEAYGRFNYTLEKISINNINEASVFTAVMCFRNEDTIIEINARTSDALIMAVKCGKPIYVTTDLFQKVKMRMDG
jgi:bifunctional DNase/RNase